MADVKAKRNKEEHFTRADEDELDAFYREANQSITEFRNDSRASRAQVKYARESIAAIFDKIRAEKALAFPNTTNPGHEHDHTRPLEMAGYFGDSTPQKPRKRTRY